MQNCFEWRINEHLNKNILISCQVSSCIAMSSSLFVNVWHLTGGGGKEIIAAWFQNCGGPATASYVNLVSAFCTVTFHLPIFEKDMKFSTSTACRSIDDLTHSSLTTD